MGTSRALILASVSCYACGWVKWRAVGSLNGGEVSHKVNREVVLTLDTPVVYACLPEVFQHDWDLVTR